MALFFFVAAVVAVMFLFAVYNQEAQKPKEIDHSLISRSESRYSSLSVFEKLGLSLNECNTFRTFLDRFNSYEEVVGAIKKTGMVKSDLIIGIDFSASNEWQGRKCFGVRCLHDVSNSKLLNPYQRVLTIMAATMEQFDDDHLIPTFGFGDKLCRNDSVFALARDGVQCKGFDEVLERYLLHATHSELGGPTCMAPIIEQAVEIVKDKKSYHILLIITDGQFAGDREDIRAIIRASEYPLSIVVVGVGDGPWDVLQEYDDKLLSRHFDNLQFVPYQDLVTNSLNPETALALHILMEIPDQYAAICRLGYIDQESSLPEVHSSNEYLNGDITMKT